MGEVYAARDSELGRSVAVKLMSPSAVGAASVEGFIQEAKAASALNHPNIVTIYEVIHASSRIAIVMELVDGVSFASCAHRRCPSIDCSKPASRSRELWPPLTQGELFIAM